MKRIMLGLALTLICSISAISARAGETIYTDQAAFLTAAGGTQVETFGGSATGSFSPTDTVYGPVAFNGFSVSGNAQGNFVGIATNSVSDSGPNYPVPSSFTGQNYLEWADANGVGDTIGPINFIFSNPTTAFGFDWFNTDYSDQYQVSLPDGSTYSGPPFTVVGGSQANSGFFGVISSSAISSASISNAFYGGYISDEGLDNVYTSGTSISAIPEASTWLLMVAGIGGIGLMLRRAKQTMGFKSRNALAA